MCHVDEEEDKWHFTAVLPIMASAKPNLPLSLMLWQQRRQTDFSFKRPPNNIWANQLTQLDTVSQSQRRVLLFPVKKELTTRVKYQEPLNIFLDVFKSQH